jgi:hypothetical protein
MNIEVVLNVAHLLLELTFTVSRFAHSCYSVGIPQDHVSLTLSRSVFERMSRFTICTHHVILCGKCGICLILWVGDLGVDVKMILKCILGQGSRNMLTFLLQPETGDLWHV